MSFDQVEYFEILTKLLTPDTKIYGGLNELAARAKQVSAAGNKLLIFGNGGSAAIASHASVDLNKNAHIRAMNFNEASLLTCLTNDFGQDYWPRKAAEMFAVAGDLIIIISSSGTSKNMLNLMSFCQEQQLEAVTFTGMDADNPLRGANSKGLNFWVDSWAYNHIETVHQTWILFVIDICIGKYVYKA